MKRQIVIMFLILVMCLGLSGTVQADEQEQTVVYVNTTSELKAAVEGSDVKNIKVILGAKDYALETGLYISGQNITIQGTEGTRIVSWSESDIVIDISHGRDITLNNLIIGHDIPVNELGEKPDCTAGVIHCSQSDLVTLIDCDIFGCGKEGISGSNSTIMAVNTTIRDCSDYIMNLSGKATFQNCTFSGNGYKPSFTYQGYAIYGDNIEFLNCIFSDNKNPMRNKETNETKVTFTDCQFYRNAWDGYVEPTESEKNW